MKFLAFLRWCYVCIALWMPLAPSSLISELYPLIRAYIYLKEQMVKTRKKYNIDGTEVSLLEVRKRSLLDIRKLIKVMIAFKFL